jgi:hypothetical protein
MKTTINTDLDPKIVPPLKSDVFREREEKRAGFLPQAKSNRRAKSHV